MSQSSSDSFSQTTGHSSGEKKVALVTGSNRGIGFETCKQLARKGYRVILTSREPSKGEAAAQALKSEGLDVVYHQLDVTRPESISALYQFVVERFKGLDVLINNAGVLIGSQQSSQTSGLEVPIDQIRSTLDTNVYGAIQLIQKFGPLMKKRNHGRIVNVSSGMGQLSEMDGGYAAYRISKTALNAVTRIFANELASDDETQNDVLVNSVCPGWVKTDMGGAGAEREVSEGADTVVWLATLPQGSPTGGFFRDREKIDW